MTITTERMELMARMLDVAALRHDVIAQNVANLNTPGFRTADVRFEEALQSCLGAHASGKVKDLQPEIVAGQGSVERSDGNNVDIDREMARLQKNALYFKVYLQLLANELAQNRSAISGR